jgi:hypothetical protein
LVDYKHAARRVRATDRLSQVAPASETLQIRATERGGKAGEYVSGTFAGATNLTSGRYAMIDDGLGFSLVTWQPVLDQHITGIVRSAGIECNLSRKPGQGL